MSVQFNIALVDLLNAHRRLIITSPKNLSLLILNALSIPLITSVIGLLIGKGKWLYVACGVISGCLYLYNSLYPKRRIKKFIKNSKGIIGTHTIEICENGLRELTSVNDSFHAWESISKVEEDKKYLYFYLNTLQVHVIPKKAFSSLGEADVFMKQAMLLKVRKNSLVNS